MIKKLEISGVHTDINTKLKKYAQKKIGSLDKYMPRHARTSAHIEIRLVETKAKDKNHCACEVTIHLPKEVITVKEATINMFAAIDIVETKLKNQLKKYKGTHENPRFHRRAIIRLKRTFRSVPAGEER